ncbi:MAG: leucine-rich repeat domain-containing protein [Spirochaetaceae bacterium]|nr:leucine-rich repeat domain-containing protein [Spirochaetaceae bacterium]
MTAPGPITEIGDGAFMYCSRLRSAPLPPTVIEIGKGAFDGCRSLTSVAIPNSALPPSGSGRLLSVSALPA